MFLRNEIKEVAFVQPRLKNTFLYIIENMIHTMKSFSVASSQTAPFFFFLYLCAYDFYTLNKNYY